MGKVDALAMKQVTALVAVSLTATTNGLAVDTQGAESCSFLINVGDFVTFDGTNNLAIKVQEGELADGSDMADIPAADYVVARNEAGAAWDRLLNAAAEDEETYIIGVAMNTKRYRRLVFTEAGVVTVPISASAILSSLRHQPAGATQVP